MPVSQRSLLAATFIACACGPDTSESLADASWVVGRYATGGGCSQSSASGEIYGYIIGCTSREFEEIEFFADGRVESKSFGCLTTPEQPRHREISRWRATSDDGVVIVEPGAGNEYVQMIGLGLPIVRAEVQRTDDCFQVDVLGQTDTPFDPPFAVIHRGEFEYFDPMPSDDCETEARAVSVPECPYDEDD